jgi:hypothetical protein
VLYNVLERQTVLYQLIKQNHVRTFNVGIYARKVLRYVIVVGWTITSMWQHLTIQLANGEVRMLWKYTSQSLESPWSIMICVIEVNEVHYNTATQSCEHLSDRNWNYVPTNLTITKGTGHPSKSTYNKYVGSFRQAVYSSCKMDFRIPSPPNYYG